MSARFGVSLAVTFLMVMPALVRAQSTGACCEASECSITTDTECEALGGHFASGALFCVPSICGTGACCVDGTCVDDDGAGGFMDESLCDDLDGVYLGGAVCDESDPCGPYRIPNGYEVVRISASETDFHEPPRINNCGQIVFGIKMGPTWPDAEVFLYDNGQLTRLTDNDVQDSLPRINDHGTMVWRQGRPHVDPVVQIVRVDNGKLTVVAESEIDEPYVSSPTINRLGHVAWKVFNGEACPTVSDILYFDGSLTSEISADGAASQGPSINNRDEIVWTRYVFPCGGGLGGWTSDIMLYSQGATIALPSASETSQAPDINESQVVTFGAFDHMEMWKDGVTTILGDGHIPSINARGDIAYETFPHDHPLGLLRWEVWLYSNGVHRQISDPNDVWENGRVVINDAGEMVWKRVEEGLVPVEMLYMRRIRTGDVDLDNDVDLADFGHFAKCYTGPVITDGLCECRFLDIDHDRDVDSSDFDLFLENYTGEPLDCHGNTLQDRFDAMLAGTFVDCNANGAPDDCDLSGGASQDLNANAIPDACDCPTLDTVGFEPLRRPKNRYLTIEPNSPGVTTAIRVTLTEVNGFEGFNGEFRWVGPPTSNPDENVGDTQRTMTTAPLQCEPHYHDWGDLGRIHIHGAEIVPGSTYDVQVVQQGCENTFADQRNYSEPFTFRTAKWGDMIEPFSGSDGAGDQPDFTDIAALVSKFTADASAPDKARMQLQPSAPNPSQPISFSDIASGIDAFTGATYPFPGPTACP